MLNSHLKGNIDHCLFIADSIPGIFVHHIFSELSYSLYIL